MNNLNSKKNIKLLSAEGLVFVIAFALVLLLPLALFKGFASDWLELKLYSPIDISMIEWTGGFLNIFQFLLLMEYFRQTHRKLFLATACGFLAMGLLNFFYALIPSETEMAVWFKAGALFLGSVIFLFSFTQFKKTETDNVKAFFHFVIPSVVLTLFLGVLILFSSKIFPSMVNPDKLLINTDLARIVFVSIGGLFYISAIFWFHNYVKERNGIYLLFAVIMLVYAQMAIVVIYAPVWTLFWWCWHVLFVLASFVGAIYLLVICIQHSLIWRLLLSLGFIFGITVIITSAVVQSYLDRLYLQIQQNDMNAQQKQYITERSFPLVFAVKSLKHLQAPLEQLLDNNTLSFHQKCEKIKGLLAKARDNWSADAIGNGVTIISPKPFSYSSDQEEQINFRYRTYNKSASGIYWEPFKYRQGILTTNLLLPLFDRNKQFVGYTYHSVNTSKLIKQTLAAQKTGSSDSGRIIFNKSNGNLLYSIKPSELAHLHTIQKTWKEASRKLMAKCINIDRNGKVFNFYFQDKNFSAFANLIPETNIVIVDIVDQANFHISEMLKIRHVIAYVAMIALLVGIIILLLLLNYQLAMPLNTIVNATKRLETGDFTAHLELRSENELGMLAKTFNHMVNELKTTYKHLEELLQSRTEALSFVEKANRSQIVFFENVTHELRTPLHSILNFSRFGLENRDKGNGEKNEEFFKNINTSASRLMKIIDNLLDMAVFEGGDISMDYSKISLLVIALQAYEELKPLFEEKKVSFRFEKPDFDTTAEVDRKKISQAIKHILSNSVHVSPSGGVVKVDFVDCDDFVSISFSDQGPGIPKEKLGHVFDKFAFIDTTPEHADKGYGLSICKEIIKLHNGKIIAQNLPEQGFVLTFTIPKKRNIV